MNSDFLETTLTVIEAPRNFAEVVNRAYYRREATTLLKNGKSVVPIVPATPTMKTAKEIAAEMTADRLRHGVAEAEAFETDLLKARAELPPLVSAWDRSSLPRR